MRRNRFFSLSGRASAQGYAGRPDSIQNNTAIGRSAGNSVTTGSNNTFLGKGADAGASGAIERTAIGYNAVNSQADYFGE